MRIDIVAVGSRGDVQPCVALGLGLQRAGHQIRLVTLAGFEEAVAGLPHLAIGGDLGRVAATAEGRAWAAQRQGVLGFVRGFVRVATTLIETGIREYWQAGDPADVLIVTPMGLPVGAHVAERVAAPLIRASFAPSRHDWAGRRSMKTALRADADRAIAGIYRQLMWLGLRATTNSSRRQILDLPPMSIREPYSAINARQVPVLDAYSPAVVPAVPACSSWIHVTGYWFLEEPPIWEAPTTLRDFLDAGPRPVFVGFGSTPFPNPDAATTAVIEALKSARQRGIVIAGGSGLATGQLCDDVLSVEAVPHSWLFPRVAAAVHHGGAGVTGAVLRAGLPSVVVPIFGDQPFWGKRLFDLGVGARPIPAARLTAPALADALARTTDRDMRRRAAALGGQVRQENGIQRAIDAIERIAASHVPERPSRGSAS